MYATRTAPSKPVPTGPVRLNPADEFGRVLRLQAKPFALRTPGETAELEAFDLAREYPGELARLLAGIRAGLHAASCARRVGGKAA